MIDFTLTAGQKKQYDAIVAFAQQELNRDAAKNDREQVFAAETWKKCGALKLQGLCAPADHNGLGLDVLSTAISLEALGYGCEDGGLAFSVAAHLLSCVMPVALHGTLLQKEQYLSKMAEGKLIAANAMTEEGSGSDAFSMQMTSQKNGDRYLLNGQKVYVSNAPVADLILVYALTHPSKGFHGGVSAFLLDRHTPGITCSEPADKMGLRSCMMGGLAFENVSVGQDALLGEEGAGAMIFTESMLWERALIAAIHVGTMQRIVELCAAHARTRTIKEVPIAKQQVIAHRIAGMSLKTEASRLMMYKAAHELQENPRTCMQAVSSAKIFVSESLNSICHDALGIFGAAGYMTGSPVERPLRDALASVLYSGTNDVQKNIIAAWMGL